MMSSAVAPLQESEGFRNIFVTLGHNPFLGIIAGALVTAVIQSSSASVGILQSLAAAGLVPFNAAVYIIMGQNIGTCVTAIMSVLEQRKRRRQQRSCICCLISSEQLFSVLSGSYSLQL